MAAETKRPIVVFRERLLSRQEELEHALEGSGVGIHLFIRAALTAMQTTPELAECSFESMWIALLRACRDQLLPDGVQGAIVPYNRQAQWIPMYRGMLNRFQRSGFYKSIKTGFHRKDDLAWRIWTDEIGPHFLHDEGPGEGEILHTYASATLTNGGFFLETMTPKDMEHVRSKSRARADAAPWKEWREQMERKTVLKRLLKILPTPAPLAHFAEDDDGNGQDQEPWMPPPPRPRGAQAALQQFAESSPPDEVDSEPTEGGRGADDVVPRTDGQSAASDSEAVRDPGSIYLETAYERGKEAKRQGLTRDDIPTEYTERGRGKEAVMWRKGLDEGP